MHRKTFVDFVANVMIHKTEKQLASYVASIRSHIAYVDTYVVYYIVNTYILAFLSIL